MFFDRKDAGAKLAACMPAYKGDKNAIILGLPRGGVVVAYEVAKALHLPLDVICPRKIGAPFNPEFAVGAITETGQGIFDMGVIARLGISEEYLRDTIETEKKRAQQRLQAFRKDRPPRDLKGKTVILIDDGLATGSTMKAAIMSVKAEGASKVVVAVPVSPEDTHDEIAATVDDMICLATPPFFQAIGQFYNDFSQVEDDTVIEILKSVRHRPD